MAVGLGDDPPSVVVGAQRAHGQMIGQGAGGHEDRPFLAQEFGDSVFQNFDNAAAGVAVRFEVGRGGQLFKKSRCLGRRERKTITVEAHDGS